METFSCLLIWMRARCCKFALVVFKVKEWSPFNKMCRSFIFYARPLYLCGKKMLFFVSLNQCCVCIVGTSHSCSTSTSWSVLVPWCSWSSSVQQHRYVFHQKYPNIVMGLDLIVYKCMSFCLQMCVERCPERFLTLVNAKVNSKDFEYYKKFCKEGLTSSMVSFLFFYLFVFCKVWLSYLMWHHQFRVESQSTTGTYQEMLTTGTYQEILCFCFFANCIITLKM